MSALPRSEDLGALVEDIYAAGRDDLSWQSIMARVASIFAVDTPVLVIADFGNADLMTEKGMLVNPFGSRTRAFLDHYQGIDIFPEKHLARGPDDFVTANSLGIGEEYRKTEYYNDFMLRESSRHHTAGYTHLAESQVVAIGLGRLSRGEFLPEERSLLAILLSHFRRALMMWLRLQEEKSRHSTATFALDALSVAAAAVDESGAILWRNRAMESLFSEGVFLVSDGCLSLEARGATTELRRRIFHCASARYGSSSSPLFSLAAFRQGGQPLVIEVLPMRPTGNHDLRGALVLVTDPSGMNRRNPEWLRRAFHLTPAQVRLAQHLGDGLSVTEAAREMRITVGTARNYKKQLFAKIGVNRQSELVAMLRRLSALSSA